jgi:hypothetical protein
MQLLRKLNGDKKGAFHDWLVSREAEPRIAWYPSAGEDFRDLLYLSQAYSERNPGNERDPAPPELFLHTDYFPWSTSTFLDHPVVHTDGRTYVRVNAIEELPSCHLPLDPELVDFPKGSHATGKVLFLTIGVHSDLLGSFSVPVLYAFVENSAFCSKIALPSNGKFSHIVRVRYGGSLGGGRSSGIWLLNVLRRLGCECFVFDGLSQWPSRDENVYARYPDLDGPEDITQLQRIRVIPSDSWSGYGDVSWNLVLRPPLTDS